MSGAGQPIGVLLADDEPLMRQSLRMVIDSQPDLHVVGEAGNGDETVRATRRLTPDLVLMDIRMPGSDGIHATGAIAADPTLRGVRVLVLSMYELDEYVYGALRAGASGFLLKDAHPVTLLDAIRRTHAGESLFAP
ncbi:MAG: response regulator transcription factor, partial [Arachnia sp.]